MSPFLRGVRDAVPVMVGYAPVAFSFGVGASQLGLSVAEATLASLIMYAGAAQFVLLTLLASGAGVLTAVGTIWLINVRHLFYGPPLVAGFAGAPHPPWAVLGFGLTDEVFAATVARLQAQPLVERGRWYLGLELASYASWVVGTIPGVLLGNAIAAHSPLLRDTLQFALPALFFSLLLDIIDRNSLPVCIVAAVATVLALTVLPAHLALVAGMLAGAVTGAVMATRRGAA